MTDVVLDASAVLALLKEEEGGDQVLGVLDGSLVSAVNLAEVASHFVYRNMPIERVEAMLMPLPVRVVPVDGELAFLAARLRRLTSDRGLSIGDRLCLALAIRENAVAWTADRQWLHLGDQVGCQIRMIR